MHKSSELGEDLKRCASALLQGSAAVASALGLDPIAGIAGRGAAANNPPMFGIAPIVAADQALTRAGITWSDVGAVELNEASPASPSPASTRGSRTASGTPASSTRRVAPP